MLYTIKTVAKRSLVILFMLVILVTDTGIREQTACQEDRKK
jgi:hypothetical protein